MSALNQQLSLFAGLEEASLYHEHDSRGFVAVCTEDGAGKFHQWCVKPSNLAAYLDFIEAGNRMNVWLSQGEFSGPNRRIVNLVRMGVCFLDLDVYKSPAKDWSRQQVLEKIHDLCREAGIPSPSLIVFSGRGYQVKWLLSSYLPRAALVRWNLVQEQLVALFKPLGADPAAKDAARILRLIGTINLKSGKRVEVVYAQGRSIDTAAAFDFEQMTKALLPLDRQRKSAKPPANAPFQLLPDAEPASRNGKKTQLKGINTRVLAWDRLEDLRTLAAMRGGIGEGMRNTYLLIVACQMALCGLIYPQNFRSEVRALQAEISTDPKWLRDRELLGSLQARVEAHNRREKIEYNGRELTPIYTYKTATIISLLSITRAEQEQLKTLISSDLATERNTIRERSKRRASGVAERAEYLSKRAEAALERRESILLLHAQGLKPMQIMAELSVSRSVVMKALAGLK